MTDIPKAKIYTRTGDKGKTSLSDGSCVEKFNPRVEAYGCVDELNSQIGYARSLVVSLNAQDISAKIVLQLDRIQNELFVIGSLIACADSNRLQQLPQMNSSMIQRLEKEIDTMSAELSELREFILPSGHPASAYFHVCRTSCRRSERRTVELQENHIQSDLYLQYLNRLSDWFFVAARWINFHTQTAETTWKKS